MKKLLLVIIFFLTAPVVPMSISAHPGNTDSFGCHTCRTNCPDWGLSYGEYHCHTPKTPTYTIPDYTTSTYTQTPVCTLFATYNNSTKSCECNYGYVASGSICISRDQLCRDQLGYSSRYNSLSNTCECSYGYVIDGSGRCASGDMVCWNKYGYQSKFNTLNNLCECNYGYSFNKAGNKCISKDESCQEQYGFASKSAPSNMCECKSGYEFQNNKCVPIVQEIYEIDPIEPVTPIKLTTPLPAKINPKEKDVTLITEPTIVATPTSSPAPSIREFFFKIFWNRLFKFSAIKFD